MWILTQNYAEAIEKRTAEDSIAPVVASYATIVYADNLRSDRLKEVRRSHLVLDNRLYLRKKLTLLRKVYEEVRLLNFYTKRQAFGAANLIEREVGS